LNDYEGNVLVSQSKEQMLEQFREDLRRMGPDGTCFSKNEDEKDWEECHRVMDSLLKNMQKICKKFPNKGN